MGARLFENVGVSAMATPRGYGWPVSAGLHVGVALVVATASALARVDLPPVPSFEQDIIRLPLPAGPPEGLPALPRRGTPLRRGAAAIARPLQPRLDQASTAQADVPDLLGPVSPTSTGPISGSSGGECAGCEPGGDPNAAPGAGGGAGAEAPVPMRISAGVQPPRKLHQVDPIYPELARAARVEGRVVLDCVIGVDGRVTDVRIVRGVALLNQAAVDAVGQWVYVPTLLSGRPVPVILTVTVDFHLAR